MCCLEEWEAMCFWHSCHSPFEKCIKAIAELVGPGLGTRSCDHHPNLSGKEGMELLLIVECLKCTTVPLNDSNPPIPPHMCLLIKRVHMCAHACCV